MGAEPRLCRGDMARLVGVDDRVGSLAPGKDADLVLWSGTPFEPTSRILAVILGGVWAADSWGRFWGWDPKETWALITWLVYAAYIHTRIVAGWSGHAATDDAGYRLLREFEDRVSKLHRQGKILGGVYSGRGQEAIVVGVCYGLRREDFISPLHRDMGAFLVKGVDPNRLMAQLFGKKTGLSKGKDSFLHAGDLERGVFGATSMLASTLPVATGAALAFQQERSDRVCVCSFGDGTANRGDFHENLNLAASWRLPIVYVCQHNGWAISQPARDYLPAPVANRAAGYAMPGVEVDGNDLDAVRRATVEAIARARGEGQRETEGARRDARAPFPPFSTRGPANGVVDGLHPGSFRGGEAGPSIVPARSTTPRTRWRRTICGSLARTLMTFPTCLAMRARIA